MILAPLTAATLLLSIATSPLTEPSALPKMSAQQNNGRWIIGALGHRMHRPHRRR